MSTDVIDTPLDEIEDGGPNPYGDGDEVAQDDEVSK